jgi:hypothetical protein
MQRLLTNTKKANRSFNFTFRFIDDVLSLNNSKLDDYVDLISPIDTIHNKYVLNQKLEHFDDIRFRDIFDRIRMFFLT